MAVSQAEPVTLSACCSLEAVMGLGLGLVPPHSQVQLVCLSRDQMPGPAPGVGRGAPETDAGQHK